jgi:lysophospholipase L1-like esterase
MKGASLGRAIRDGWLVLGVTLALLVGAELVLRVGSAVSRAWRGPQPRVEAQSPLASADWYQPYMAEFNRSRQMQWEPYLYFRRPAFRGAYITVDSAGHRVTPQAAPAGSPRARMFLFGGSTMWGSYQRDDRTIPAEVARRLAATNAPAVEVTNYGESGYVFTQEMLALILQLRAGNIPDVVVFYDGINDVAATVQDGVAGIPQNESNRAAEFAMGRALQPSTSGLRADLHAWGTLAAASLGTLELTRWIHRLARPASPPFISADSAARSLVRVYTGNVRVIDALAENYGFKVIYVWQPSLHATTKRPTPFESRLLEGVERNPFQRRLRDIHQAVPPILDSAMATVAPGRFIDASALFRGDTLPVFVDQIGHTTESAIPAIVDTLWPALVRDLPQADRPRALP